jgi:hypothetical protein
MNKPLAYEKSIFICRDGFVVFGMSAASESKDGN